MKAPGSLFFPVTLVCLIASNLQAEEPAKYYQAVEKLIISGKYEEAIEALKDILEDDPKNMLLNRALGYCLEKIWDYGSASEVYLKVIKAGDENPDTEVRLGVCLQRLNRFEEATEHYASALRKELRPDGKVAALSGLAECYFRLGKEEEYGKYLEELRSVSGKAARLIEGRCLNRNKKYKEAELILSKLHDEYSDDAGIVYELARSLLGQKRDHDFVEKLLEKIKPNNCIRRIDIEIVRCHLYLNKLDYKETMRLRKVLEKVDGLIPDERAYRDEIFKAIDDTF